MQSDTIGALALALSKAQADITGALKDSANPFFKSKYADLASCWDACRKQLAANELAVIQTVEDDRLVTILAHSSGEWIRSACPIRTKDDSPQALGSAITYARRYALAAIVGLAQIDDDAEAAQARGRKDGFDAALMDKIAGIKTLADLTVLFLSLPEPVRETHGRAFTARKMELSK